MIRQTIPGNQTAQNTIAQSVSAQKMTNESMISQA